jgi:hypothetical protein
VVKGINPVIFKLEIDVAPLPVVNLEDSAIVGLVVVLHTSPLAVIEDPPVLVIAKPLKAFEPPIAVIVCVVIVARFPAFLTQRTDNPSRYIKLFRLMLPEVVLNSLTHADEGVLLFASIDVAYPSLCSLEVHQ